MEATNIPLVNVLLRLGVAYIRSLVVFTGSTFIILGTAMLFLYKDVTYLPMIVAGLIFIFPVSFLKSPKSREIYLGFLIPTTILNIVLKSVSSASGIQNGPGEDSLLFFIAIFSCNAVIITSSFRHILDATSWNPFFSGRARFLNNLLIPIGMIIIFFWPFIPQLNIHNTPDGFHYFDEAVIPPHKQVIFTDTALNSDFELASYSQSNNLTCILVTHKKKSNQPLSVISEGKPLLIVNYDADPITLTVNPQHNDEPVVLEEGRFGKTFFIGADGLLVESNYANSPSLQEVNVNKAKPGHYGSYSDNKSYDSADGVVIILCKEFDLPANAASTYDARRFKDIESVSAPWNVRLVEKSREIEVIKEVIIKYQAL